MTEREFLDKLSSKDPSYSYSALLALALAKQQGAKFDPEPVELPPIIKWQLGGDRYSIRRSESKEPYTRNYLNQREAEEVIRRCELIPRLRKYITDRYLRMSNGEVADITPHSIEPFDIGTLLDMIDGRDVQSVEGEDHAINP